MRKGVEMDWRLISAVTLAGASFSMVAFGAYTLRAADALPDAGRAASPLLAAPSLIPPSLIPPSLIPLDAGVAGTVRPERGVSFVPVAPGAGSAAPQAEGQASSGAQVAALDGASPFLAADLPVLLQDKAARPSWRWRHGRHVTWKVGHSARFCTLQPCEADRKHQVAARHTEEHHGAPKIALMLGVGF